MASTAGRGYIAGERDSRPLMPFKLLGDMKLLYPCN